MHRCSFCGKEFLHGVGILYVRRDGTLQWFCSRRCRVYLTQYRKDARRVRWTEYYGQERRG